LENAEIGMIQYYGVYLSDAFVINRNYAGSINIRRYRKLISRVKASEMIHRRHGRPSPDVYTHLALC